MKFRKTLLSLAAVLSLCGLTSCGDSSSQTSDSSSTPVSSTTSSSSLSSSSSSSSTSIGVPEEYDIGQITAAGTYTVRGLVNAMNDRAMVITDGDDSVYVYGSKFIEGVSLGDYIEVSGKVGPYNNCLQYSDNVTVTVLDETCPVVAPEATVLTSDVVSGWATTDAFTTKDVKLYSWTAVGGTMGQFKTLNFDGVDVDIETTYQKDIDAKIKDGTTYNVEGYFIGYSVNHKYAAVLVTSLTEAA